MVGTCVSNAVLRGEVACRSVVAPLSKAVSHSVVSRNVVSRSVSVVCRSELVLTGDGGWGLTEAIPGRVPRSNGTFAG